MKRRLFSLLLTLSLLCSLLPAVAVEEEAPSPVAALCVASPGEPVFLDLKELQLLCRQATGRDLDSVVFASGASGIGTISHKGERVTAGAAYYQYRAPQISEIRFTPYTYLKKLFTGQGEISFTMTNDDGETVPGVLTFYVPEAPDAEVSDFAHRGSASAPAGEPISLYDPLPAAVWHGMGSSGSAADHKVASARFSLPSSSQGALWLDYGTENARKLHPEETLYTDKAPNLYDLTFVPAGKEAETVELRYTVSTRESAELPALLTLTFTETAAPEQAPARPPVSGIVADPFTVFTQTGRVDLSSPLREACRAKMTGSLETVVFDTLPLSGEGAIFSEGQSPVTAGTAYPCGELSFLPGQDFQGGVTLRYLGTDSNGGVFSGYFTLDYGSPSGVRFQDMTDWAWAADAAHFLGIKGYCSGESLFRPGDHATRMELIHALVLTAYPRDDFSTLPAFSDLPADEALSRSAAVAAQRGLVLGNGAGLLLPNDPITRQDALVILYRALAERQTPLPAPGSLSGFFDAEDVAPYAREAAAILSAKGVLLGDGGGKLDPLSPITRAEMACLLYRAFG